MGTGSRAMARGIGFMELGGGQCPPYLLSRITQGKVFQPFYKLYDLLN